VKVRRASIRFATESTSNKPSRQPSPDAASAAALCCRDDDPAVAAAEVVHDIVPPVDGWLNDRKGLSGKNQVAIPHFHPERGISMETPLTTGETPVPLETITPA